MMKITLKEFHELLRLQGVPREHIAMKCVVCGTVQSMRSLILAGAGKTEKEAERYFGFSCVGRFTNAGPFVPGTPPGRGCNWTLGGLFLIHKLLVIDEAGGEHPHFEVASPEEAKALMAEQPVLAA